MYQFWVLTPSLLEKKKKKSGGVGSCWNCFSTRWLTPPVNKMAASRTGLKSDKGTVASDLYFTGYLLYQAFVLPANPQRK